jgi:hypothetical protein
MLSQMRTGCLNLEFIIYIIRDRIVSTATKLESGHLEEPGAEDLFFSKLSTPASEITQPAWVPGTPSPGVTLLRSKADH